MARLFSSASRFLLASRRGDVELVRLAVRGVVSGEAGAAERLGSALMRVDRAGDAELRREALAVVSAVPRAVLRLDESARGPCYAPPVPWVAHAGHRFTSGSGGVIATALASLHADGRVREAAVTRMVTDAVPESAPFLVLRSADWVRQVRSRARAGLSVLLHDAPLDFLPAAAPMAAMISRRWRADFARGQVQAALSNATTAVVRDLLAGADVSTRRVAFEVGLGRDAFPLGELATVAERNPDLLIRLRAGEAAARQALWTARHELLRRLARARAPQVRALAVTGLVRAGLTAAAGEHLADDSGLVRAVARDAARRTGADPAERYRSLLAAGTPPAGALAGLGECGTDHDGALLLQWLDHPATKARAAAIYGLRQLGTARPQQMVAALHDPVLGGGPASHRGAAAARRNAARATAAGTAHRAAASPPPRRLHFCTSGPAGRGCAPRSSSPTTPTRSSPTGLRSTSSAGPVPRHPPMNPPRMTSNR